MYLTAVIDWYSRYTVGWRLSDTMRACEVCACARSAFSAHGTPACMNSDQGSIFGSDDYVSLLKGKGIRQSMDGKARWRDNVLIERWFRTLKSECLRNLEYGTPRELEAIISKFVDYYNNERIHQSLDYDVPADWYADGFPVAA
jgi:putative transposase